MSRAEIELALAETEIPAVKSILESRLLETLGEGELIEFLEKALVIPPPEMGVKVTPRRREDVKALKDGTEETLLMALAIASEHPGDQELQALAAESAKTEPVNGYRVAEFAQRFRQQKFCGKE